MFVIFDAPEVRNRRPIEFELPPDVRQMLDMHLAVRSPLLCPSGTPWLFPCCNGTGPVEISTFSTRLKQPIRKETGIEMSPHMFHSRVLAAARLGLLEAPVIVLGHLSEAQRRAYRIAENKLTELGGWDEALLLDELRGLMAEDFDLGLIGIPEDEMDAHPARC